MHFHDLKWNLKSWEVSKRKTRREGEGETRCAADEERRDALGRGDVDVRAPARELRDLGEKAEGPQTFSNLFYLT